METNKKQNKPKRIEPTKNVSEISEKLLRREEKSETKSGSNGKLTVPNGTEWTHYDEFA